MTQYIGTSSNTSNSAKPKWVECLEHAEDELLHGTDDLRADRARAWMSIADMYKDRP